MSIPLNIPYLVSAGQHKLLSKPANVLKRAFAFVRSVPVEVRIQPRGVSTTDGALHARLSAIQSRINEAWEERCHFLRRALEDNLYRLSNGLRKTTTLVPDGLHALMCGFVRGETITNLETVVSAHARHLDIVTKTYHLHETCLEGTRSRRVLPFEWLNIAFGYQSCEKCVSTQFLCVSVNAVDAQKSVVLAAIIMMEPRRETESGAGCKRSPQLVLHHMLRFQHVRGCFHGTKELYGRHPAVLVDIVAFGDVGDGVASRFEFVLRHGWVAGLDDSKLVLTVVLACARLNSYSQRRAPQPEVSVRSQQEYILRVPPDNRQGDLARRCEKSLTVACITGDTGCYSQPAHPPFASGKRCSFTATGCKPARATLAPRPTLSVSTGQHLLSNTMAVDVGVVGCILSRMKHRKSEPCWFRGGSSLPVGICRQAPESRRYQMSAFVAFGRCRSSISSSTMFSTSKL